MSHPILQLGEEALPFLESQREVAKTVIAKGRFAFLAARLGGDVDPDLIDSLLDESKDGRLLACQLIELSGTTQFNARLEVLCHGDDSTVSHKAKQTLKRLMTQ